VARVAILGKFTDLGHSGRRRRKELEVLAGIGDVEHHQPAMTASLLQGFFRTFNTTKSKIWRYSDRFLGDQT
jgi:hypothetical protein